MIQAGLRGAAETDWNTLELGRSVARPGDRAQSLTGITRLGRDFPEAGSLRPLIQCDLFVRVGGPLRTNLPPLN